jgi:hypothetical protein
MQNKEFGMNDNSEFDDKKFMDMVTSTLLEFYPI